LFSKGAIKVELQNIEQWISEAEKLDYSKAVMLFNGNIENSGSEKHEYLRLKNGFYEGYLMSFPQLSVNSSVAAKVYGRYFLFYEFLKGKLGETLSAISADGKLNGYSNENNNSMMFETLSDCGKCEKEFITDEKDLCTNCPIKPVVKTQKDDLVKKFNTLKEVEGAKTLSSYLEGRITECRKKIEDKFNFESRERQNPQTKFRPNRISVVLSFKEYIKFYSQQLELLNKKSSLKNRDKVIDTDKSYSHKQITIAYYLMGIQIDASNANEILKEHSELRSTGKLLQKRVTNNSELSKLTGNKSADTKHLKDLEAAERLVSGKNNKTALSSIKAIITAFKSNRSNQ
jgi:hypothetical protein